MALIQCRVLHVRFSVVEEEYSLYFVDVSVLARAHRPMTGKGREAGRAGPWEKRIRTLDTDKRARVCIAHTHWMVALVIIFAYCSTR